MYKKTVLPNGLKIVTHHMKERDSIAVGFWIGVGGRYEGDAIKGAAHFLEHILFKGSENYSCNEIKENIEGVGGTLNAFTAEEQTCYFAKIPSKYIKHTCDVLSDMVFAPLIKKRDIEKERTVIIEEIKMYHDLPQYYVLELLEGMIWPDHPLGKNLAGTMESVSQMTQKDLRDIHKTYYTADKTVIAACGNIEHESFVNLIQKKLKSIVKGTTQEFLKANNPQNTPRVLFARRDIEQMHMALGLHGLEDEHKDIYTLNLLHIILGGNMSSRLFNEVREKRGLAYSIGTSMKSLKDTGMFLIRAGVDNKKLIDAVEVIVKELRRIKRAGITEKEFIRAKDYYLGQLLLGLEDTMDQMLWAGESILNRNKIRTRQELIRLINKIKMQDVLKIAKEILNEKRFNLAIVGPIESSQEKRLSEIMGLK